MASITAFILSFNQSQKLPETVSALLQQEQIDEILILENGSTEPMETVYKALLELPGASTTIHIEKAPTPLSFSDGQNWAIERAKNPYILLVSNDAILKTPNSLGNARQLLENNDAISIVGFKIIQDDGRLNHFGVFQLFFDFGYDHYGRGASPDNARFNRLRKALGATAACMLIKRSELRFDPAYWFMLEDVDFCLQHLKQGKEIWIDPTCTVYHTEKGERGKKEKLTSWDQKQEKGIAYFKKKWKTDLPKLRWRCLYDNLTSNAHTRFLTLHKLTDFLGLTSLILLVLLQTLTWQTLGYLACSFLGAKLLITGTNAYQLKNQKKKDALNLVETPQAT